MLEAILESVSIYRWVAAGAGGVALHQARLGSGYNSRAAAAQQPTPIPTCFGRYGPSGRVNLLCRV